MRLLRRTSALAAILSLFTPEHSLAWGLKTHLWIAQEVLNDAEDGSLSIAGGEYPLSPELVRALRTHPDRFRAGSLGPDVFPDPIVGQTTFHPGVEGGWQTDDWLGHLLRAARTPEEVAFAYGFATHVSGDVFAHTYVNAYAGDIFWLAGERTVEVRHFSLEKYIETLTPELRATNGAPISWTSVAAATSFARDLYILDGTAAGQYLRAGTGLHLAAIEALHRTIGEVDQATQDVVGRISRWLLDYLGPLQVADNALALARLTLEAADAALDVQEAALGAKQAAYDLALRALDEARRVASDNPGLIAIQERLFLEQAETATELLADATRIASEVEEEVGRLQREISRLRGQVAQLACDVLFPIMGGNLPSPRDLCHQAVNRINNEISGLEARISDARNRLISVRQAADAAARLRDATRAEINRLRAQLDQAVQGLANGTYDAAVSVAEADLRLQEQAVEIAREGVREAREKVDALQREVDRLNVVKREAEALIARFNIVSLFLRNWQNDVTIAAEEYIKASQRAGIEMLDADGDPLEEYLRWLSCYGAVFTGVPRQVGQAGCYIKGEIDDLMAEYDRAIQGLPEFLRWVLNPTGELKRLAQRELGDEFDKATNEVLTWLTDEDTAELLTLLRDPATATRDNLNKVFREDDSGKNLLIFDNVADTVDLDLGIVDAQLSPEAFLPLQHSVTLSKLALLGPNQLNGLATDLTGSIGSPYYGAEVYPAHEGNFSILLGAVRNIDGNHQWQAYGLPWPRRTSQTHPPPRTRPFGRDFALEQGQGLRFWVDPYLRERVFLRLFRGSAHGVLGRSPFMQWPYPYPECAQNPYPSAQDTKGRIVDRDETCRIVANPDAPPTSNTFSTPEEYVEVYLTCGARPIGGAWTVAGSFQTEAGARARVREILSAFPDLALEVWQPRGSNLYWTVMAATCVPEDVAQDARSLLIRRGIAHDAFVWTPRLPWSPADQGAAVTPTPFE